MWSVLTGVRNAARGMAPHSETLTVILEVKQFIVIVVTSRKVRVGRVEPTVK